MATANLPASLTVNSLFPQTPRRTFFVACAGPFAGMPAPTGLALPSGLCLTCGSGRTREKAGTGYMALSAKLFLLLLGHQLGRALSRACPLRQGGRGPRACA
ncbi:hypothetical protein GEV39_01325 [Pseudomonas sp. NY5710]|nr:hypothetical protein GEV39_01325 [Pseudomonas sp. NY5710]